MKYLLAILMTINVMATETYMMDSDRIMMAEYIMSTCTDTEVFVYEEMKCVSYIENEWEYFEKNKDDEEKGYEL